MSFDRQAVLAAAQAADARLLLVCGSCPSRRVLDRLHLAGGQVVGELVAEQMRRDHDATAAAAEGELDRPPSWPRPALARDWHWAERPDGHGQQPDTLHYRCHPRRCGASYRVNAGRLLGAFLAACHAGRGEIVAGVDIG